MIEYRDFDNKPVRSEDPAKEKDLWIDCRFATFTGQYDMGWGCYERISPHAFDETVGDDIRVLFNHETGNVLGRTAAGTAELHIAAEGLDGKVLINEHDSMAMDVHARVERGDISGCSIGFEILSEHVDYLPNDEVLFTIDKVKLYECSICTFPAYKETSAHARSAGPAAQMRAFKFRMKERLNNAVKSA